MRKRQYIKKEWCEKAVMSPIRTETEETGRIRHWLYVEEIGKYLRVVTLSDKETIHNAFPDRRFKER